MTTDEKNMALALLSKRDSTYRRFNITTEKETSKNSKKPEWTLKIFEQAKKQYGDDRDTIWEADGLFFDVQYISQIAATLGVLSLIRIPENYERIPKEFHGQPCFKMW